MFNTGKTRMTELAYAEENMMVLSCLIQYRSVTDGQTDRIATSTSRASIAVLTCDKNNWTWRSVARPESLKLESWEAEMR